MDIRRSLAKWLIKGSETYSLTNWSAFERAFNIDSNAGNLTGWVGYCTNIWGYYFSKAKFEVFEETPQGLIKMPDHPMQKVYDQPNNFQVNWEIKALLAQFWVVYGQAYFLKLRSIRGNVIGLVPLMPNLVTVETDDNDFLNPIKYYYYNTIGGQQFKLTPDQVIDLRLPNYANWTSGKSILSMMYDQREVDALQTAYQRKFYKTGGFSGRTFVAKQAMDQVTFDRVKAELEQFTGDEGAYKLALLEMTEPVKYAYSMKEMDIKAIRELTRDEVAAGFAIPKILLGTGDGYNKSTAEAAIWQFTSVIIDPLLNYVDEVFSIHLRNDYPNTKTFVKHQSLTPRDVDQAVKREKELLQVGALTLNEVRDLEGLPLYPSTYKLANTPLWFVGGGLVDIKSGEFLSPKLADGSGNTAADNKDPKKDPDKDTEDTEDKPTKSLETKSDGYRKFARRHSVLVNRQLPLVKQQVKGSLARLERYLLSKGYGDIQGFFSQDEEMNSLYFMLSQLMETSTYSGFSLGANEYNVDPSFYNLGNDFIREAVKHTNDQALNISQSLLRDIENVIGTDINHLTNSEIASKIAASSDDLTEKRANRITNTTITAGMNAGILSAMKKAGIKNKMWLSERDKNVRVAHIDADGQIVPIDEKFIVDGERLDFPSDPVSSAWNAVNCRCTLVSGDQKKY